MYEYLAEHWATGHPEYLEAGLSRPSNNNDRTDEKVTHGMQVIRISFIVVTAVYLVNIPDCY